MKDTGAQARSRRLVTSAGWGERMHLARTRAGLTLDEVGKALGITGGAVSRWESENSYPSRKNLEEFADLVKVSSAWLAFAVSVPEQVEARRRVPMRNPWTPMESAAVPVTIECRFPCSASAFGIEAFEDGLSFSLGVATAGDIFIVDPEVKPEYNDLVFVMSEKGPRIRVYFPEDAYTEIAQRFLDAVEADLSTRQLPSAMSQRVPLFQIKRLIGEFRGKIPISTGDKNKVSLYESVNKVKVIGVVVEHTRRRYSTVINKIDTKPDPQDQ